MRSVRLPFFVLLFVTLSATSESHDFREDEEPGYEISIGKNGEEQTQEQFDFLNCTISEYMKLDYVEACAIFKSNGGRYVDCRHEPDTYEKFSDDELSDDRDTISNTCAKKAFGTDQSSFGKFFSDLWASIFGEG